jgi:hypothetical protein
MATLSRNGGETLPKHWEFESAMIHINIMALREAARLPLWVFHSLSSSHFSSKMGSMIERKSSEGTQYSPHSHGDT